MLIRESFLLAATNTDIFAQPSRLGSIPSSGRLTLEMSARVCNESNQFQITLQTPDGDLPFEDLVVPAGDVTAGELILNTHTQLSFTFPARQGGHFLFSAVETGTALLLIHATLVF